MLKVVISPITVKKSLTINVVNVELMISKAILLGSSGERLKNFHLKENKNVLSLDEFHPGAYALRIESGEEVIVRQIIIP